MLLTSCQCSSSALPSYSYIFSCQNTAIQCASGNTVIFWVLPFWRSEHCLALRLGCKTHVFERAWWSDKRQKWQKDPPQDNKYEHLEAWSSQMSILILHFVACWQVGYWKDMEQEEAAEKVKTEGNESSILLTGLEGNTLYHLTVRAYNAAGYGPPSTAVRAATKKSRKWPQYLCSKGDVGE